jgi:hypothetical protein
MDNVDVDQMLRVRVERVHDERNVMEIVELPTLGNERITQQIFQSDGISVL